MSPSHINSKTVAQSSTLVDYVQFSKWHISQCKSDDEGYQVSDSYAMGLLFHFIKKMPERPSYIGVRNPSKTAPSFFTINNYGIRQGCNGYGHGIVYEGRWVLYKGIPMKGQSKLNLKNGIEFEELCKNDVFVPWFKKVLDGEYRVYDFDKLSFEDLESLTSPNAPGSLASTNPTGFNPSASLATKDGRTMGLAKRRKSTDPSLGQESTTSIAQNNPKRPNASISSQPTNKRTKPDALQSRKDAIISVEKEVAPAPEVSQQTGRIATEAPVVATPSTGIPQNQAANPGRGLPLSENQLEGYIYVGTMTQLKFAWDECIRQGSVQFYDRSVVDVLSTWAQNRHSLVQDLMQPHTSSSVARVTLARALSNDPSPASANLGHQSERDLDNHMHMCIVMQSLFAWDESIRQRSSNFYDRSQR
ncbi:hypothetical protein VE03_06129 [Pseudogymnoascus sp. 23342-1-I1]|nr:hypothetical protein VE03_06129 [Pseudogymnoascus sp. 23342-1-I1]